MVDNGIGFYFRHGAIGARLADSHEARDPFARLDWVGVDGSVDDPNRWKLQWGDFFGEKGAFFERRNSNSTVRI